MLVRLLTSSSGKAILGALLLFGLAVCPARAIDASVKQLVVSIAPAWDASSGKLQLFERDGKSWRAVAPPVRVLYGKNGLAWGRGLLQGEEGLRKLERDKRAPAGVFAIGKIYTYDAALPEGANFPFHTITERDAWIDDPSLPEYNRHVVIDPKNPPSWFEKQKCASTIRRTAGWWKSGTTRTRRWPVRAARSFFIFSAGQTGHPPVVRS